MLTSYTARLVLYPGLAPSIKVSAVIITYNESKNIRRTLSQLHWCDEIVVVDSYSTDDTLDICREFGCTIFFRDFEGYGTQKKFAVSKASNDWILCIDADEVLSGELCKEIQSILLKKPSFTGYQFPMNPISFSEICEDQRAERLPSHNPFI